METNKNIVSIWRNLEDNNLQCKYLQVLIKYMVFYEREYLEGKKREAF